MMRPSILASDRVAGYGCGLFVSTFAGHREFSQDGNSGGFSTELAVYPDAGLVVAVATNGSCHDAEGVEKSLTRLVLGIDPPSALDLAIPASLLWVLPGDYSDASISARIWVESGRLVVMTPGGDITRLMHQGKAEFVQENDAGTRLRFEGGGFSVVREGKFLAYLRRIATSS
jgi:hypothetical protein